MGILDSIRDRREGPFTVVFVCTGNICRSPQGEALLRAKLDAAAGRLEAIDPALARAVRDDIRVESAGTHALVGHPTPDEVLTLTAERGADTSAHRARLLDDAIMDGADLILVMEREQRRRVVSDAPRATKRTFTLREFARWSRAFSEDADVVALDSGELAERLRDALPEIAAQRALVETPSGDDADVADPYRRDFAAYRAAAESIDEAVEAIAAAFLRVVTWAPGAR